MTVILRSLKNDLKAEREGDWVAYPPFPGTSFLVKSSACPEFMDALQHANRKLQAKHAGEAPLELQNNEYRRLTADILLLGWKGFDEEYTRENAAEILGDVSFRQIHDAIAYCTNVVGRGQIKFVEDTVKN